jgi:hypothetical protein
LKGRSIEIKKLTLKQGGGKEIKKDKGKKTVQRKKNNRRGIIRERK